MATYKSNPKPYKLALDHVAMEADFFENVQMLSIICPHEAYHLAWLLNRHFPVEFVRALSLDIQHGNQIYSAYKYNDEINHIEHSLYATRAKTHFILPGLKNIDFIWMIQGGHLVDEYIKLIPPRIKRLSGISDCRIINHEALSQRQVFLN